MIEIFYSDREIEIRADRDGFDRIRNGIQEIVEGRVAVWKSPAEKSDPASYEACLTLLAIELGEGPNNFRKSQEGLVVQGDLKSLTNLGRNLPVGDEPLGYHHHYDDISFAEYVSPGVSVILTVGGG